MSVSNIPDKVATDGLASYPRAIEEELGEDVEHEVRSCNANPVEQSHRGIKHRYYPTLGFGEFGERPTASIEDRGHSQLVEINLCNAYLDRAILSKANLFFMLPI